MTDGTLKTATRARARQGFTLIELLIVVVIIGLLAGLASVAYGRVRKAAEIAGVAAECRSLYNAFYIYHVENGRFPNATSAPFFQLDTFEPLDHGAGVTELLLNGQADAFDSPDNQGPNQEFWLLMTLRSDPTIRFVVASSDDVPLASGEWLEGVYLYRDGALTKNMSVQ